MTLRHATKAGDSSDISRRHSTANARKTESVISKDLVENYKDLQETFEAS